jgi:hypothetical protein
MTTICTVQDVVLSSDTSYTMIYSSNYHDIFQFSYLYDITPSVILPNCTTITNGHRVSLVNTDYLSINVSVFDESTDTISSWGLTGIRGTSSSDGNSTWPSISATTFTLPPHMSVTLLMLDNTWYTSKN